MMDGQRPMKMVIFVSLHVEPLPVHETLTDSPHGRPIKDRPIYFSAVKFESQKLLTRIWKIVTGSPICISELLCSILTLILRGRKLEREK